MRVWKCLTVLVGLAGVLSSPAFPAETRTYTYDALGRLMATSSTGTVNNGISNSIAYDPAGNRTSYAVTGAAASGMANPDLMIATRCVPPSVDVAANDTDPEANYPLTLTAVSQPWATVETSTTVGMTTPDVNGVYQIGYTIADTLGATANGALTVAVAGSQQCF